MHMKTLKSVCSLVSTMSALSFSKIWLPWMIVANLLSTDSLARLISSSKIQSPFCIDFIRVPSTNWKINPPPDSSFLVLF
jgi:hypothetical protein